ncbi:DUF4258 domain-containing protein [Litorilinea aerophila]|uniref:DUF4258 domain-containing protein n=1 Tax=Litorilinea aerophila TaxID=1204385 RepID=UPI001B86A757|nr:DUF4258 domain-containing protein [Litorilinea aerophila]MCC9079043.1 DUF4258 domain-containing protein [Litorilinea aerophila]GIV79519.1 MAG: DUF4258 domain-containing protein [Litorilinea sp.]
MAIRYTRHARYKFEVLERHGFPVTESQIADTLARPDIVIQQPEGRYIAQKRLTERHVLRVVYRHENSDLVVITFYPGRRARYEDPV